MSDSVGKAAHRLGDENNGGGPISSIPQSTVFINNLQASIDGSAVDGHFLDFPTSTAGGSPTVFITNIPANRTGDEDECGHIRDQGSPNVFIGDGAQQN